MIDVNEIWNRIRMQIPFKLTKYFIIVNKYGVVLTSIVQTTNNDW